LQVAKVLPENSVADCRFQNASFENEIERAWPLSAKKMFVT
jgi:hypothetical protein